MCRLALCAWDDPKAIVSLGAVYDLMRQGLHRSAVSAARAKYTISSDVSWGLGTFLSGDGSIDIGPGSYIGYNAMIVSHPAKARIVIGRNCAISHSVQIRTEGYRTDIPFDQARKVDGEWASISIGDNVWIGANVFVCPGVMIGENSVIGANSVVTKNVPPDSICGGVPAKLIRYKSRDSISAEFV